MNTEQQQRIEQIRAQQDEHSALFDATDSYKIVQRSEIRKMLNSIDDLLSIVKGQEADRRCSRCGVDHWQSMLRALTGIYDYTGSDWQAVKNTAYRAIPNTECQLSPTDAATSMRSLCVEKVSEILNQLMIELPPVSDSYLKGQGWNSALARANNEIVPALESLSIQEQK